MALSQLPKISASFFRPAQSLGLVGARRKRLSFDLQDLIVMPNFVGQGEEEGRRRIHLPEARREALRNRAKHIEERFVRPGL